MIEKIECVVKKNPNRVAYQCDGKAITYEELWKLGNHYGDLLKREGTGPVIIYGKKSVDFVVSILSCLLAGRAYVPVDSSIPFSRFLKIMEMTKATLVLFKEHDLSYLESFSSNPILPNDNNISYIIFTSGSTGNPKGVPISNKNLNHFVEWISKLEPLSTYHNIVVFNQAHFSFDLSVADLYYSLCNGHTLVSCNDKDDVFSLFRNESVCLAVMTPTFMKYCLLSPEFQEKNLPQFQCVYFCGERLDNKLVKKLWERFPSLRVVNAYGPTEATSAVSGIEILKEMLDLDLLPVGVEENFATEIEIVQNEIVLKGDSVFSGYLGDTGSEFYKVGYKTGDRGIIRDGKLYCLGRLDYQIKFNGYRIELEDIENNINHIEGVLSSCVVAKEDNNHFVKTIQAFVMVEDKTVDADFIRKQLLNILPNYMIPKTIQIIDKFPMNSNQKIDRKALENL